jgi:hypothetical protein
VPAIAASPAYQPASSVRKSGPTETPPSGSNATKPESCGEGIVGIAANSVSTPNVRYVSSSISWRCLAMVDFPEPEMPFRTITGGCSGRR